MTSTTTRERLYVIRLNAVFPILERRLSGNFLVSRYVCNVVESRRPIPRFKLQAWAIGGSSSTQSESRHSTPLSTTKRNSTFFEVLAGNGHLRERSGQL